MLPEFRGQYSALYSIFLSFGVLAHSVLNLTIRYVFSIPPHYTSRFELWHLRQRKCANLALRKRSCDSVSCTDNYRAAGTA